MKKVRKQFVICAMAAVFTLLTVLLFIINGVNFTMLAEDADQITQMLAKEKGAFSENEKRKVPGPGEGMRFRSMEDLGPNSPELAFSARYFTYRFDKDGNAEEVSFHVSAFSKEEAEALATGLLKEKTGWTGGIYRYRVYKSGDYRYVTVLDQGREMLPAYRTLIISMIGEGAFLIICFGFLTYVSGKLFRPLEEADRKQKQFLAKARKEFQIPLTVIGANTELMEKEYGTGEYTQTIRRQVKKMSALTKRLEGFSVFKEKEGEKVNCDLSMISNAAVEACRSRYEERKIGLTAEIEEEVLVKGDEEALQKVAAELLENGLKYSISRLRFQLKREEGHVVLRTMNDTTLPDQNAEAAFDRFAKLENASDGDGMGLGLSYVKDIVKEHNGRVSAIVKDKTFELRITL